MSSLERSMRVLSVDGDHSESHLLKKELEKFNDRIYFKQVFTISELKKELQNQSWNMVFSDYWMNGFTASDALSLVRESCEDLPFLLVSEGIGEEVVADLMKAGAEDVVLRNRLERLLPVVKRILREHNLKNKEVMAHKVANEAFAAKEQMLAIVSHDIKNPISAIQLEAQMLLRAVDRAGKSLLGEEVKIQANRILRTTDRMKNLISDLLDKNKSENGLFEIHKEQVNFFRFIQDILDSQRPLIQEKDILITNAVPEGSLVPMDRPKMFQVFSNLINNAVKFTPIGGTIQISMEESERGFIFCVDDSGMGLDENELHKVFDKYWTGNSQTSCGTGLGLFICKTIVEAHGGVICVENLNGLGARFKLTVPRVISDQLVFAPESSSSLSDKRKKVYIIDDDEDLREVMSWALSREGFLIKSFHSPIKALDSLLSTKRPPNLIVLDFYMDEMKGSEFVLKLNQVALTSIPPIMMISASPQDVEKDLPRNLYKEVITKPVDLEGLVDNVRKFCN